MNLVHIEQDSRPALWKTFGRASLLSAPLITTDNLAVNELGIEYTVYFVDSMYGPVDPVDSTVVDIGEGPGNWRETSWAV